jgi:hypothetical protein
MNKILIGNNKYLGVSAYENSLLSYVYGRATLSYEWSLFLLPYVFYSFHHAIEISIKTLLKLKGIKFPNYGQLGHKTYNLLSIAVGSDSFSKEINNLIADQNIAEFLNALDDSYLKNKYEYPGYSINGISIRDTIDKIIFAILKEINLILESKIPKHVLANLYVPEEVEKAFLCGLKIKPITYTALRLDQKSF